MTTEIHFYDGSGNRRKVTEFYYYDASGNRRTVTEGYYYDASGNRRKFYAANGLPAPFPLPGDYPSANFTMLPETESGGFIRGYSSTGGFGAVNPTTPLVPATGATGDGLISAQLTLASSQFTLVYDWNTGDPTVGAFHVMNVWGADTGDYNSQKFRANATYTAPGTQFQWSWSAFYPLVDSFPYVFSFHAPVTYSMTAANLGAGNNGFINGVGGSLSGPQFHGYDVHAIYTTVDEVVLQLRVPTAVDPGLHIGHKFAGTINISTPGIGQLGVSTFTAYSFYDSGLGYWIAEWLWDETTDIVAGSTPTVILA